MLLKAYDEVRKAPDPTAATEMAIVRIAYASDLPGPEEALKRLQSGNAPTGGGSGSAPSGGGGTVAQFGARAQPRAVAAPASDALASPQSFDDVTALIAAKRDIGLKLDVERFVRLVAFRPGAIEFEPAPKCPPDLAKRLAMRLREWTGQPWLIAAQGGGGAESRWEREQREKAQTKAEIENDPFVLDVKRAFPGAEVISVTDRAAETPPPPSAGTTADSDDED
jgi:DNA polymerase-3 subunit gamma/tau